MSVGVLALQGGYAAHRRALEALGVANHEVRTPDDLEAAAALVLPGGESSAINRLFQAEDLGGLIAGRVDNGMPILATCAGTILLARATVPSQPSLGLLDVDVVRNAYGRQVASSVEDLRLGADFGEPLTVRGVFIRAPRIVRVGVDVQVLAWWAADPVLVRHGRIVAATYHPELGNDLRVHQYFCSLVEESHG